MASRRVECPNTFHNGMCKVGCSDDMYGRIWGWNLIMNDFAILQSGPSMVKWNVSGG